MSDDLEIESSTILSIREGSKYGIRERVLAPECYLGDEVAHPGIRQLIDDDHLCDLLDKIETRYADNQFSD